MKKNKPVRRSTEPFSQPGSPNPDTSFEHVESAEFSSHLLVLEDRILYDAAPFDVDAVAATDVQVMDADVGTVEVVDWAEVVSGTSGQSEVDDMQSELTALESLDNLDALVDLELAGETSTIAVELVVIDSTVENYEQLLDQLTSSGTVEVLVVEPNQNGFQQVGDKLDELGTVSAVHFISHGDAGELTLGNTTLSLESLASHADEIAGWQDNLTESADLLFYGCDLAGNSDGQMLLSQIVDLTDADVAASTDLTGHDSLGGDWILEFESGNIETEVIVTQAAQALWYDTLAVGAVGVEADTPTPVPDGFTDIATERENRGSSQAVAMDDEGNYVIVWSALSSTNGWEILGQHYDSQGNEIGSEFTVNQTSTGDQQWASVDMDGTGNYVVTWVDQSGPDSQVMGRYFGDGGFDSGEFVVGAGEDSSVTINDAGQYAFVWETSGTSDLEVRASYFDSDHSLIRGDFLVDSAPDDDQRDADISLNSHGDLAVVWETNSGVWAKRFDSAGTANGDAKFVAISVLDPTVELRDDGFMLVGVDFNLLGNLGVRVGVLDVGNDLIHSITVNETTSGQQQDISIAILNETDFAVTWSGIGSQSGQEDSDGGVYFGQYSYNSSTDTLTELVDETRINSFTDGDQGHASIAARDADNYVIVWDGPANGIDNAISHELTRPVNHPPEIVQPSALAQGGEDLVLEESSFGYQDDEPDSFTKVKVVGLPSNGELLLDGVAVTENQEIEVGDIAVGKLVYNQTADGYGDSFDSFQFQVHDGTQYSSSTGTMDIDVKPRNVLWVSTKDDVSGASDVPGLNSWDDGDTLEFSGLDLQLGADTTGSFLTRFRLDGFVAEDIDAVHYVTQAVTIGTSSSFTLNAGDVVFSLDGDKNVPGISEKVQDNDIVVFRATSADYSTGDFTLLFDYSSLPGDAAFNLYDDLKSLTIVEQTTTVGDTVLEAGQILFTADGKDSKAYEIQVMSLTDVGLDNSVGTSQILIDGKDVGIDKKIDGIELIEVDSNVGGQALASGTLLFSVDKKEALGDNNLNVEYVDVVRLDVSQTSLDGSAAATASILFDGGDVGLEDGGGSDIDALSVMAFEILENDPPEIEPQTFAVDENAPNGTVVGTVLAYDVEQDSDVEFDVVGGSGAGIFEIDPDTGQISVIDSASVDFESASVHTLHISVTDSGGLVETAEMTININNLVENTISGNVFNDFNANGNVSDDGTGFVGAAVHLYQDLNGNNKLDSGDSLIETALTDADGHYVFDKLDSGEFFVVVDSRSLTPSQGFNTGHDINDVWAEQTYGSTGSLVFRDGIESFTTEDGVLFGGRTATGSDDLGAFSTMEHVTRVSLNDNVQMGVDYGFSFNVVTNLEGGDVAAVDGQTVQGSLRQFIINANTIVGGNEMRFVPVVDANQADRGTWQLDISEALPEISDHGTVINGQAWSQEDGISAVDPNSDTIGNTGVTVGVHAVDLDTIDRPELELISSGAVEYGLLVTGNNVVVDGLRIEGFGTHDTSGNLMVHNGEGFELLNSHLLNAVASNLVVGFDADDGRIHNNVIQTAGLQGILLDGENGSVSSWDIYENYILNNGQTSNFADGIDVQQDATATIRHNLIAGNAGSGIDTFTNTGAGIEVLENTISGNGEGGQETSGVRLFGSDHSIRENLITGNEGAGVFVLADGPVTSAPSHFNEISMNEFGLNGGIAIDLGENADTNADINAGDGVSDFSVANTDAGNAGILSPQLTSSTLDGGTTVVEGTAGPNQRIELYAAVSDSDHSDASYGEGVQYLGWTMSDGSGAFSFTTSDLAINDSVSAIAIDSSFNTSEFSTNLEVNEAPTSQSFVVKVGSGDSQVITQSYFTFLDNDLDDLASVRFDTVPTQGQLFNGPKLLADGDSVSAADIASGRLRYVAPMESIGSPLETVTFRVSDGTIHSDAYQIAFDVDNDAPVIGTSNEIDVNENEGSLTLAASDADGDSFSFSLGNSHDEGLFTINPGTGELTFVNTPSFENPLDGNSDNGYVVEVMVTDAVGNQASKLVTVNVQDVNEPVTGLDIPDNVDENSTGGTFVGFVQPEDQDQNDTYTYTLLDDAGGTFVMDPATGEIRVAPGADLNHEVLDHYEITVLVTDAAGHFFTETTTIQINDINEAPVAVDMAYGGVNEGAKLLIDGSDFDFITDPDGDDLAITAVTQGSHGSVRIVGGNIQYVHNGSEYFTDTFQYVISDGKGGSDTATITITINPVNDAPTAQGEQFIQAADGDMTVDPSALLVNDSDPDSSNLTVVVVNGPATGKFDVRPDGTWFFAPDASTPAIETVQYYVTDGEKNSQVVTAELVTPVRVAIEEPPAEVSETESVETSESGTDPTEVETETSEPVDGNPGEGNATGGDEFAGIAGPVTNSASDGFGFESRVNDLDGEQTFNNNLLADNSLLTANYGFSYQKSSVELSQLMNNSTSHAQTQFADGLTPFDSVCLSGAMWESANHINEEVLENISSATGNIVAAASLTGLATAVYVLWMARGGMLVASVVSAMPAWQSFDPLPILQYTADNMDPDAEDDSIESLLDRE